jgi:hypothetical protein
VFEFDAGVRGCEMPICLGMIGIAVLLPGCDFVDEDLFVRDSAVETLTG